MTEGSFRRWMGALAVAVACVGLSACNGGGGNAAEVPEEAIRANILGTAYLGQQKWAEAEAAFREARSIRPGDPRPANNLAVALMQQGRNDEAQAILEEAVAADPSFAWAQFNLGLLGKNAGEFDAAAKHFLAVAEQDPDDLLTQYNLGIVLSRIEREAEAEQAFRKALSMNPTHVSSLYGLGRLLLQRGDQEEGARLVAESQEIRARSGLDSAVGTQYGEQGPYAMGSDYPGDALAAPGKIEVGFAAGAALDAAGPVWTAAPVGADARPTLFGIGENRIVSLGTAASSRVDFPSFLPDGSQAPALTAADWNNDGRTDLGVLIRQGSELLFGVQLQGSKNDVPVFRWSPQGLQPAAPPLTNPDRVHADLVPVDRDHDGDLDAFWCWSTEGSSGCRLATNDGSGTFAVRDSIEHGFALAAMAAGPLEVAFSDLDNDRDVDLLVVEGGGLHVLTNQRDDTFAEIAAALGLGADSGATGGRQLEIVDLNKDGAMDLLVGDGRGIDLLLNRGDAFEPDDALEGLDGVERFVVLDYDNDGLLDIAYGSQTDASIARNLGRARWDEDVSLEALPPALPLGAFDADGDGDADLIAYDGQLRVLRNDGGNARRWISISPKGVGDNLAGIGAKIEVLAGALRQKFEVTSPLPLHVGLGERESVESVRFLWPSGVLQDEVEQSVDRVASIEQLDRKGTSCPLLYAWTAEGWSFVTDFLGGAAVGYQLSPGKFNTPDTDEYIKIETGLHPRPDGTLAVRWNNQLEEVLWFDQAQLLAIDHPAGTQIFPNEKLMPGPPWPEFELFSSADVRPVVRARDVEGDRDVTDALLRRDRRYAGGFADLPYKGYAELHTLELEFRALPANRRTVLLLDGWIDYADSSANVAAHQAGVSLVPPQLLFSDGKGGWTEPDTRVGFPAGLPKTMSIDLGGRLLAADPRLRIRTNMRIHWDRAQLLVSDGSAAPRIRRLAPLSAELRHGGFPVEVWPNGTKPQDYDPSRTEPFRLWKAHRGHYTGYGPVEGLLQEVDDRMVTTRNGDELEIVFPGVPPAPEGWTRTYLIYADGFGKDMDPNSAAADSIAPLPFHGMPHYPYGDEVEVPPAVTEALLSGTAQGRYVPPAPDGLHGAVPQAYAAERLPRRP